MKIISENNHLRVLDFLSDSNIREWHSFLKDSASFSENDIAEYQEKRLNDILKHANDNTDFYKNQLSSLKIDLNEKFHCVILKK